MIASNVYGYWLRRMFAAIQINLVIVSSLRLAGIFPEKMSGPHDRWKGGGSRRNTSVIFRNDCLKLLDTFRKLLSTLKGHSGAVKSLAFSPDGKRLASGAEYPDGTVNLWNSTTGKLLGTLKAASGISVKFSPDGKRLASGGYMGGNIVRLWDGNNGSLVNTLKCGSSQVESLVFSPDSNQVASGNVDGDVTIWQASSGKPTFTIKAHSGTVRDLTFSPNGKLLASCGWAPDDTVKLWDVSTGRLKATFEGIISSVSHQGVGLDGGCPRRWIPGLSFAPENVRILLANSTEARACPSESTVVTAH